MAREKSSVFHGRTIAILVVCVSIPLLAAWYIVQYFYSDIFYNQKGEALTSIAWMLDTQLGPEGYAGILRDAHAENAPRDTQIAVLNEALREATDKVALTGDGLGVGFYSRELDAILTYGPSETFGGNVGTSIAQDHPGRTVMATNAPLVRTGTMVRGNIMNAMVPVQRGGEVIGYIWANELVSDLENMLRQSTAIITVLLLLAFLLMIGIVVLFLRQMMKTERKSRASLEAAAAEVRRIDGLMRMVNDAVSSLLTADEDSFEAVLEDSMNRMAMAFEVDRLLIWRKRDTPQGPRFQLVDQWQGEEGQAHCHIDFEKEDLPPQARWPQWRNALMRNESVTRNASEGADASWLEPYGIRSIITVPVLLQEAFWGFVSFTNCHSERSFTPDEETILFSGSLLMANAVARNDMMQRLVQAREEALAGTRAKSAFLASMSHEMRTPMNAIIGMAAIGTAAAEIERKDYAFGKIGDASTHLLGIINDVLDISKIESGKLELSPEEFVFEEMLQRVVNVTEGRFAEKKQSFLVRMDADIPATLIADDQRLAQVITNLLSNAVKFTPQGGSIRVDARLLSQEENLCILQFDVADTGIGLDPEQQARIFNSFEQAESSTTRKYGGTGLGLSISKNLVEMMGGTLSVASQPGQGATFSFTVRAQAGGRRGGAALPEGMDWSRARLLAVDADADAREYFAYMAGHLGLRCDTASDAGGALALAQEDYDLCFLDFSVPPDGGVALAGRLRETGARRLVLLAPPMAWDIRPDETAGIDRFLSKPVLPSALARCVYECLGQGHCAAGDAGAQDAAADYAGRHILLAEDVDINREILIALLEDTHLSIDCAVNGAEAVRMFREAPDYYDMIFMDVQMPEMDGLDATRAIRAMDVARGKTIPIVAMTANVFKEDIEACRAAGMDDHLGKPLDMDEVMRKLGHYLG